MKFANPIAIVSILIFLTAGKNAISQTKPTSSAIIPTEEPSLEKLKKKYVKTMDSLLLEERYRNIIEVGELLAMDRDPEISKLPIPYLICAYYLIGNSNRSKKLLEGWISKMDYKELVNLLTNNNIAFIKYFNEPWNREPIINRAINDYKNNTMATDKQAGEQIIRFFINDQCSRKVKYAFKKEDQIAQAKVQKELREQDSIQNAKVYVFYKKHGKYFNAQEVGETISGYQPIILSHYDNIERRQTFFKDMLEKAVKEGRLEKTNYVHFILRTESFTNPEFFKNLEKRMEEVRKEYDLPDYLWNPF